MTSASTFAQKTTKGTYVQEIETKRNLKDQDFKSEEKSPLMDKDRKKLKKLSYFPVDSTYRVEATFVRDSTQSPFKMKASANITQEYVKYGELYFNLKGSERVLTVYQNLEIIGMAENKDYLFIPFTDETNDFETYGGGRYLDFRIPKSNKVTLDFNLAYNPYCAYSPNFSCPIPPSENHIPVKIQAGEKGFK